MERNANVLSPARQARYEQHPGPPLPALAYASGASRAWTHGLGASGPNRLRGSTDRASLSASASISPRRGLSYLCSRATSASLRAYMI